jgi:hypothetical protein
MKKRLRVYASRTSDLSCVVRGVMHGGVTGYGARWMITAVGDLQQRGAHFRSMDNRKAAAASSNTSTSSEGNIHQQEHIMMSAPPDEDEENHSNWIGERREKISVVTLQEKMVLLETNLVMFRGFVEPMMEGGHEAGWIH